MCIISNELLLFVKENNVKSYYYAKYVQNESKFKRSLQLEMRVLEVRIELSATVA